MARVNNTLDKFGRQKINHNLYGPPGIGFKLTPDGQYNILGKALTNVADPKNGHDATTKEFVMKEIHGLRKEIAAQFNKDIIPYIRDGLTEINKEIEILHLIHDHHHHSKPVKIQPPQFQ